MNKIPLSPRNAIRNHNLLSLVKRLDELVSNHIAWLKCFHHGLICDDSSSLSDDLATDAHRRCQFGQWLYTEGQIMISKSQAFDAIEELHKTMHDSARTLLGIKVQHDKVCSESYDCFMDSAIAFKNEVRRFQHDLIDQVCTVDHLTGAWNRHEMVFRLNQEVERTRRSSESCSLVMMDIDYFKTVNDTYGHIAGDSVLRQLVDLCSQQLRTYDAIFRYGGEEFLFCFPGSSMSTTITLVERLQEIINTHDFKVIDDQAVRITVSFGISTFTKDKELDDAMQEADHALLCAKSNGRDCYCVWEV